MSCWLHYFIGLKCTCIASFGTTHNITHFCKPSIRFVNSFPFGWCSQCLHNVPWDFRASHQNQLSLAKNVIFFTKKPLFFNAMRKEQLLLAVSVYSLLSNIYALIVICASPRSLHYDYTVQIQLHVHVYDYW